MEVVVEFGGGFCAKIEFCQLQREHMKIGNLELVDLIFQ